MFKPNDAIAVCKTSSREWLAITRMLVERTSSLILASALCLKPSSPTESHSSIRRISGRTTVETANAKRRCMPVEYVRNGMFNKIAQLGKFDDIVDLGRDLGPRHAQQATAQVDVFSSGGFRIDHREKCQSTIQSHHRYAPNLKTARETSLSNRRSVPLPAPL